MGDRLETGHFCINGCCRDQSVTPDARPFNPGAYDRTPMSPDQAERRFRERGYGGMSLEEAAVVGSALTSRNRVR